MGKQILSSCLAKNIIEIDFYFAEEIIMQTNFRKFYKPKFRKSRIVATSNVLSKTPSAVFKYQFVQRMNSRWSNPIEKLNYVFSKKPLDTNLIEPNPDCLTIKRSHVNKTSKETRTTEIPTFSPIPNYKCEDSQAKLITDEMLKNTG